MQSNDEYDSLPSVSIIVACRNERAHMESFLNCALAQTEPCEIVVADGMSEDGTRAILDQHAVRWMNNPRRIASTGLNLALRASSGEIVIRMDAHTIYSPDYVAVCLAVLAETGAMNVGGPARTKANGFWQQAIALAFHSPFFSGGARFHDPSYEGPVDTIPYGCWRRSELESLGAFDETLVRNQDDELNFRIRQRAGLIWQSPSIRSWYAPRRSLLALARQYCEYGFWKVAVIRKHGRPADLRHVAPAVAMCVLVTLGLASIVNPIAFRLLITAIACYAFTSVLASLKSMVDSPRPIYLAALPAVFGTVHVSYAAGLLAGLIWGRTGR